MSREQWAFSTTKRKVIPNFHFDVTNHYRSITTLRLFLFSLGKKQPFALLLSQNVALCLRPELNECALSPQPYPQKLWITSHSVYRRSRPLYLHI